MELQGRLKVRRETCAPEVELAQVQSLRGYFCEQPLIQDPQTPWRLVAL
jgi:hypothetical protein